MTCPELPFEQSACQQARSYEQSSLVRLQHIYTLQEISRPTRSSASSSALIGAIETDEDEVTAQQDASVQAKKAQARLRRETNLSENWRPAWIPEIASVDEDCFAPPPRRRPILTDPQSRSFLQTHHSLLHYFLCLTDNSCLAWNVICAGESRSCGMGRLMVPGMGSPLMFLNYHMTVLCIAMRRYAMLSGFWSRVLPTARCVCEEEALAAVETDLQERDAALGLMADLCEVFLTFGDGVVVALGRLLSHVCVLA